MSARTAICLKCNCIFTPSNHSSGKYCSQQCYQSVPKKRGDLAERFWSRVDKSDGCWLWTGSLKEPTGRNRYGILVVPTGSQKKHRAVFAHRLSWEFHFGKIPDGLMVCHHCDNPPCVRPDHLFLGTNGDNQHDAFAKGRKKAPDNRGERHGLSKLTAADVIAIRASKNSGARVVDLAGAYHVAVSTIYAVLPNGAHWKHIS